MFCFTNSIRRASLFAVVACVGMLPSVSRADGVAIYKQDVIAGKAGKAQTVFNDPQFFDREVQNAWNVARPMIEQAVKKELGKSNRFGNGFTLYDITFDLARSGPVHIEPWGSGAMKLTFTLNQNHLRFTSTVPGPTPKSWDPTIDVNFDMTLSMVITLPRLGTTTRITWVGANITRVHANSRSVLVAIAKFFVDSFVRGGSRGLLQVGINYANATMQTRLNIPLGRPDSIIAGLSKLGYDKLTSRVQNGMMIVTLVRERTLAQVIGTRVLSVRNLGAAGLTTAAGASAASKAELTSPVHPPR